MGCAGGWGTRPGTDEMNVLLITLDQFRGDCLSSAGHPVVRTPSLDRLASGGVRMARHYSQAAPCGPGRACLYTGTYQLNNRVVGNGTPLDDRFDNVGRAARRAGYVPTIFGYADQSLDPRLATGAGDPRLSNYQGFPPGFEVGLDLPDEQDAWRAWLAELGYGPFRDGGHALSTEPDRPAEHGVSAFMTDQRDRVAPAAGRPVVLLTPATGGRTLPTPPPVSGRPPTTPTRWRCRSLSPDRETPFCGRLMDPAPADENEMRKIRAQYYGMVSDVDHELGRLFDELESLGMWEDTFVVVTSDHGEQLGDQGLLGKGGMFESSYNIVGIVRDPRQARASTERCWTASPRTWTCSRRSARRWDSIFLRSATGCRSPSFLKGESPRGGATKRTGSTTGAGSTSRSGRTPGRGTAGSRPST